MADMGDAGIFAGKTQPRFGAVLTALLFAREATVQALELFEFRARGLGIRYLHEQAGRLTILTSGEVAQTFGPVHKTAGRKEVAAATHALERLSSNGVLCCQRIKGELHCMND